MSVTENHETNDGLLHRLRDPQDRAAWHELVALYRPMIYRIARRRGLQSADAHNVAQEVLQKVARAIPEWEEKPTSGFRKWLSTVARNQTIDWLRKVRHDLGEGGTSAQIRLQDVRHREQDFDRELRQALEREIFRRAAKRIECEFAEPSWKAFWLTMVEGRSCEAVANELGKSVGAIYTSRSRIMRRLKEEVRQLDSTEDLID